MIVPALPYQFSVKEDILLPSLESTKLSPPFAKTHSNQEFVVPSSFHQNEGKHLCSNYLKKHNSRKDDEGSLRISQCLQMTGKR